VSNSVDDLVLDLLEWLRSSPRAYTEVLDAWRTSCPRLPIWEEANARGFIVKKVQSEVGTVVHISQTGLEFLSNRRPLVDSTVEHR
jgi:hypothetical protein